MTSQGEDILAWLDNAISVREKVARAAEALSPSPWTAGPNEDESVAHIALHDPESVLRHCVADRKVLARHAPHRSGSHDCSMRCECPHPGVPACNHDGHAWPCADVRDLAEGHGWTGGKR